MTSESDYTAHFGAVTRRPPNWREQPDETPDDDEVLAETPADVVALLGFDPLELEDVEKYDPSQPRDDHGRWTTGGAFSRAELSAEARRRINESRRGGGFGLNSNTLETLAYPGRQSDEAWSQIEAVVAAAGLNSAARALDSHSSWQWGWATAHDEWVAAEALGGNGLKSRLTVTDFNEARAAEAGYRFKAPWRDLSDSDVKAFAARQKWMQDEFRKRYGDEVTVYRGVSGRYAGKLPNEGEVDVPSYSISSWTTSPRIASESSEGKAGKVLQMTIRPEDVWSLPRVGVESPVRAADARSEIVVLNKTPTRRAKIWGGY